MGNGPWTEQQQQGRLIKSILGAGYGTEDGISGGQSNICPISCEPVDGWYMVSIFVDSGAAGT